MINKGYLTSCRTSAGDEVYTPIYAVLPLLEFLDKDKIIWCPFDEEWSAFVQVLKENGLFCERTEEIDYKELENQVLRRTEEISKNCDFPIVDAYDMNTDRFVCKCMLVKKIDVISNDEKTYYAAVRMKERGKENTVTGLEGSVCYKYNDSKTIYEDRTGWGFINAEEIKKETVIALANKIVSDMKKRYSESVEVDNAIKLLKENNYIIE